MTIATVNSLITNVMFVAEWNRLLERIPFSAGPARQAAPQQHRGDNDNCDCECREAEKKSKTGGKELSHPVKVRFKLAGTL